MTTVAMPTLNHLKVITLIALTTAIIYHLIDPQEHEYVDSDQERRLADCRKWMLINGSFSNVHDVTRPTRCTLTKYSKREINQCIIQKRNKTNVMFIGDSRSKSQWERMVGHFSRNPKLTKIKNGVFYNRWGRRPYLIYLYNPMVNNLMYERMLNMVKNPSSRPELIIINSCTWSINRNKGSIEGFNSHMANLTKMIPLFEKLQNTTDIIWKTAEPVLWSSLQQSRENITNTQIDMYNKATTKMIENTSVLLWTSARKISMNYMDELLQDGLHYNQNSQTLYLQTQTLLNYLCVGVMGDMVQPRSLLPVIFLVVMVIGIFMIVLWKKLCKDPITASDSALLEAKIETPHILLAMWKMSLIVIYVILCQETTVFGGIDFIPPLWSLAALAGLAGICAVVTIRKCDQDVVLNRDQTTEWKGWMTLVMLVTHVTNTEMISVFLDSALVSYLFINCFGHFTFYWKSDNFSFRRTVQIILRMNMALLCVLPGRTYLTYPAIPMVTATYVIITVAMVTWPRINPAIIKVRPVIQAVGALKMSLSVMCIIYLLSLLVEDELFALKWEPSDDSMVSLALAPFLVIFYVLLRNCAQIFRSYHILFFTWFGKISLEVYVCYHYLLTPGGGHVWLMLIPGGPLVNVPLTIITLLFAAHEIHLVTTSITDIIFNKNNVSEET